MRREPRAGTWSSYRALTPAVRRTDKDFMKRADISGIEQVVMLP